MLSFLLSFQCLTNIFYQYVNIESRRICLLKNMFGFFAGINDGMSTLVSLTQSQKFQEGFWVCALTFALFEQATLAILA